MEDSTVIVLGDIMLDTYIDGEILRMSPEAPVPVLSSLKTTHCLGGAANVAANLAALGRRVQLIGAVGVDAAGQQIVTMTTDLQNVWPRLQVNPNIQTLTKTRLTSRKRHLIRTDAGDLSKVWSLSPLFEQAISDPKAGKIGALVVSDYGQGTIDKLMAFFTLMPYCLENKIPLFVDAKPHRLHFYQGAFCITPNAQEAVAALPDTVVHPGLAVGDTVDVAAVEAQWLHQYGNFKHVVVTCGAAGIINEAGVAIKLPPVELADPTGAGDVFLAALAAAYLDDDGWLDECVRRACLAARLSVQKFGTVTISQQELDTECRLSPDGFGKVMSKKEVARFARWTHDADRRVVFTNGVFDILHSGHLQLLDFAKKQGDALIVAIDQDETVRANKGDGRPCNHRGFRAQTLEKLADVDAVVVFEGGELEQLIHAIHPDVLVKGAEYQDQRVPGADYVASHGGRVMFAPMLPGVSTTSILEAAQRT